MAENPYESPHATSPTPRTRPTRWLVWGGAVLIGMSISCAAITIIGMMQAFNAIANSASPTPSELAARISLAQLPSIAIVPLAVVGIVMIISGLLVRRRVVD